MGSRLISHYRNGYKQLSLDMHTYQQRDLCDIYILDHNNPDDVASFSMDRDIARQICLDLASRYNLKKEEVGL